MSRGLGKTERTALEILTPRGWATVLEIAGAAVFPPDATGRLVLPEPAYRSFARALRSLAKKGFIVDLGRTSRYGARRYAMPAKANAFRAETLRALGKEGIRISRPLTVGVEFIPKSTENGEGPGVRLRKAAK